MSGAEGGVDPACSAREVHAESPGRIGEPDRDARPSRAVPSARAGGPVANERGDNLTPRRQPTQGRARVLITAIRQAAREILAAEGPDALTTNRVADRAGVSIGSLYHYYANKESIVADIFEEEVQALQRDIDDLAHGVELSDLPLPRALSEYVAMVFRHRRRFANIHREFVRDFGTRFELPSRRSPDGRTYEEITVAWLVDLVADNRHATGVSDPEVAAHMLVLLADGFARATAEERLPDIAESEICEGLVRAMLGYLGFRPELSTRS